MNQQRSTPEGEGLSHPDPAERVDGEKAAWEKAFNDSADVLDGLAQEIQGDLQSNSLESVDDDEW